MGEEHHKQALERHHKAMVAVQKNVRKAIARMKRNHDRGIQDVEYEIGDPVFLYNNKRTNKPDLKWKPYYQILAQKGPVNYLIRDQFTGNVQEVHAEHLRPANLEWKPPRAKETGRPGRAAKYAAGPPVSTTNTDKSSTSSDESEERPLFFSKRKISSSSSSDNDPLIDHIPFARLREWWI